MAELEPLSPEWWVTRLAARLIERNRETNVLRRYYSGDHPLPEHNDTATFRFKALQRRCRSNWCGLIADAVGERLQVEGFRLGGTEAADDEAWRIWQANSLDSEFDHVITEALSTRYGYMLVWPDDKDSTTPLITAERSDQVIVEHTPGNRRQRAAALKLWWDDWAQTQNATLYLPSGVYKFTKVRDKWTPRVVEGETWPLVNPFGVVPVVPFVNRPTMTGVGLAEFEDVIDIQDRINEILFNRAVAIDTAAFKQKWVTGLEVPEDDQGNAVEPFESAVNRLWISEDPEVKFGEFSESDINAYNLAMQADVDHLAAITRTPQYYFIGGGDVPSGDALKATETGLVAKVNQRMRYFGESLEEIMRLAFVASGNTESADALGLETLWKNPETRSLAEVTDSAIKLKALEIPRNELWAMTGYTPAQIDRMTIELNEQNALAVSLALTDPTTDVGAVAA